MRVRVNYLLNTTKGLERYILRTGVFTVVVLRKGIWREMGCFSGLTKLSCT